MAMLKDVATAESEQTFADFLTAYPTVDRDRLARRWDGGIHLWHRHAVRPVTGCGFAYEVRCTSPQKKYPGEQLSYTVTLRGDVRSFTCECQDWLYRGGICRHIIAAWCFAIYGPRGWDLDPALDAWLDRLNAEREAERGEDAGERLLASWERSIAG